VLEKSHQHYDVVRQDLFYFLSHLKNVRVMKCSNCGDAIQVM